MVTRFDGTGNLLGQNNMKGFGQVTRKYIGQSFEECNCLQLIHRIYTDLNLKVPSAYKGYDLVSYLEYWETDPELAIKDMIDLFRTIGKKVDPNYLKRGDLIVANYKGIKWPAIYIGDNRIMCVNKKHGVRNLMIGKTIFPIMARRLDG